MRLRHDAPVTRASFDDPNLVSCAGLEPVMRLAQACDLPGIVAEKVDLGTSVGSNPAGKICAIVAGMVAGEDSIEQVPWRTYSESSLRSCPGAAGTGSRACASNW